MGKIQRSEQQLPSVSSDTFVEPHSVHKSKITEEERALATHENKKDLEEYGGKTKSNTLIKVTYYYVNFTCTILVVDREGVILSYIHTFIHTYIFMNPLLSYIHIHIHTYLLILYTQAMLKGQARGPTGAHLKATYEPNIKAAY